jgi:hypothetical protein
MSSRLSVRVELAVLVDGRELFGDQPSSERASPP